MQASRDEEWRAQVLGVAQDGGLPHAGCRCARCMAAREGRRARERVACLGVRHGTRAWLVDATPDLGEQVVALCAPKDGAGAEAARLVGILLTHAHIGHYLGLAMLGKEAMGARDVVLHGTPRMEAFLRAHAPWRTLFADGHVSFDPRPRVDLGGVVAEAIQVPHRQEHTDTVAWRLEGPRRSILWLPDIDAWEEWDRDVADVVSGVDVAYLDGTFLAAGEVKGRDPRTIPHPPMLDTMERLAALAARVRFVHLNHSNPAWDDDGLLAARGFRRADEGEWTDL